MSVQIVVAMESVAASFLSRSVESSSVEVSGDSGVAKERVVWCLDRFPNREIGSGKCTPRCACGRVCDRGDVFKQSQE